MSFASGRVAYVGTMEDAYLISERGQDHDARSLGLADTGGVRAIVVDRDDPHRLYAGTAARGVLRSTDGGHTWHESNDGIIYKNIFSLAQHPATGDLWVGTEPANIFHSTDRGDHWQDSPAIRRMPETKDWFFPSPPHVAHVRHIGLNPVDPNDVFGAVEDGHLIRSRDKGQTWKHVKHGVDCDAHAVAFMPDDPSVICVATGVFAYRSTDGGETFVDARDGLDRGYMAQIVVNPKRPHVLLTVASATPPPHWRGQGKGGDMAVYRSEDQGLSWHRLTGGLPEYERAGSFAIGGDATDPDTALVGLSDGTVWGTEDGGESFHVVAQLEGAVRAVAFGDR